MKKLKINKSNWSGEEGTVKIYANGDIEVLGERFRVEVEENEVLGKVAQVYTKDGFNIAKAFEIGSYFEAYDDSYTISREDEDMHTAIAKVLFNLI